MNAISAYGFRRNFIIKWLHQEQQCGSCDQLASSEASWSGSTLLIKDAMHAWKSFMCSALIGLNRVLVSVIIIEYRHFFKSIIKDITFLIILCCYSWLRSPSSASRLAFVIVGCPSLSWPLFRYYFLVLKMVWLAVYHNTIVTSHEWFRCSKGMAQARELGSCQS